MTARPLARQHLDPVTLRLFVAVCEEGSIAGAAAREAIVASAVSKRIAAVEAAVGAPLLVRGRRGIEPTAAGEALLRQAREVLAALERLGAELSDFATGLQGSVHVVAAPSVLAERLPEDIGAFMAEHAGVRVSLAERVSPEVVRAVREGAADLGVLWDATETPGLHSRRWRSDRLCLVMRPEHPLARRRRLAFDEALDHVAVGVAPGGMMDTMLRRQAALRGRALAYRATVSGMDAAARIVAAGLGAAVLPREAVESQCAALGLVLVPLADPWALRRFVVVTRADGSLTAAARSLVEHLVRVASTPD